jgi:hypothetical protein
MGVAGTGERWAGVAGITGGPEAGMAVTPEGRGRA